MLGDTVAKKAVYVVASKFYDRDSGLQIERAGPLYPDQEDGEDVEDGDGECHDDASRHVSRIISCPWMTVSSPGHTVMITSTTHRCPASSSVTLALKMYHRHGPGLWLTRSGTTHAAAAVFSPLSGRRSYAVQVYSWQSGCPLQNQDEWMGSSSLYCLLSPAAQHYYTHTKVFLAELNIPITRQSQTNCTVQKIFRVVRVGLSAPVPPSKVVINWMQKHEKWACLLMKIMSPIVYCLINWNWKCNNYFVLSVRPI